MVILEILVVFLLIFINGVLAMAEMAITSARTSRLMLWEREGKKSATKVLKLLEDPSLLLSTIQVGISLVSITVGVVAGATITSELSVSLQTVFDLNDSAWFVALMLVLVVVTYFAVVLGELVPKQIASAFPDRVLLFLIKPLLMLQCLARPFVKILTFSTGALVKGVEADIEEEAEVTEEDIKIVVTQGAEIGAIEKEEEQIVHEALRLGDSPVTSFMSPRKDVFWLDLAEPVKENWQKVCDSNHTNFPLAYRELDDLRGVLTLNEFARALRADPNPSLELFANAPLKVLPTTTALELIRLFRTQRASFAVVIDEHGGVDGVVTIHDLTELLVGEFDTNEEEQSVRLRDDGSYAVDAYVDILDVVKLLNWTEHQIEEERDYSSLAGFLLEKLGRVPHEGDILVYADYEFEVIDMDGHRIDKVLIRKRREI